MREKTLKTNLQLAIDNTDAYIDMHLAVAERHGKPVVLEEFGFPRDDFQFAQGTPVTARDEYYTHVCGRIVEAAREGGLFAGLNFWGWGGLASQSPTNIYWKRGDDYCGDPAQEQQGLNSVYASDVTTTKILSDAAREIDKALAPGAWFVLDAHKGIFKGEGPHRVEAGLKNLKDGKSELKLEVTTDFGEPVATIAKTVKSVQGGQP